MKKSLIASLFLMPLTALADEVPGIVIQKNDKSTLEVDIATLQSIKFKDGVMLIKKKDETTQEVNVDDILVITFESITTAIKSLVGNTDSQSLTIADLTGRVIYRGSSSKADWPKALHGTYIIKVGDKSHKVIVK